MFTLFAMRFLTRPVRYLSLFRLDGYYPALLKDISLRVCEALGNDDDEDGGVDGGQ